MQLPPTSTDDFGLDIKDMQKWLNKLTLSKERLPLCVVSNWAYWDITYQAEDIKILNGRGFLPAAIYSENLIWDEQERWPVGSCVKTSWLTYTEHNFVFHTQNTTYLLVGPGTRHSVSPAIFMSLHF